MQRLVVNFRGTFALFVLVGGALIFTLSGIFRQEEANSAIPWILVSAVLGLMVIFGVVVWVRSRGPYASDSDAETFYYLGFIYTLLTLVATFTPFLVAGSKPSTQQILGFFGLGLITTFFGLAGRIFFLQPRSSESPETSADRLSRAYAEAARLLEASALQISRVGTELEKNFKKSQEDLATSLERATQKIIDDSRRLFEDANEHVTTLTDRTAVHISRTLSLTAEGVATALDEFKKRLAALKLPPAEFGERLGESVEALIKATTAATETITAANNELTKVGPGASLAADGLSTLSSVMQGTSKEVQQSEAALSSLRMQVESTKQSLATIAPSVEKLGTVAQAAADNLATAPEVISGFNSAFDSLARMADATAPELGKLGSQVTDVAAHITQLIAVISAAEEMARKVTSTQQTASEELLRGVELLRAHQESVEKLSRSLEQDLKASEDALRKVHSNLISATDFLTTKV